MESGGDEMERRLNRAHAALQTRMYANPEGDRKGFERVSKLPNANEDANADEGAGADRAADYRAWVAEDEP